MTATRRPARSSPLRLTNLLFTWYRAAPDSRRISATWSPATPLPRIHGQPLPPAQCYLTVTGGRLENLSTWPRAAVIPSQLAEPLAAAGPRLLRAYEFASGFLVDRLDGGFLPGTPLVLSELRMPNLRPIDGRRLAPPTVAAPSADLTFVAHGHGIGGTTFALAGGRPPELRLISAWPPVRNQPILGNFWTERSLGPAEAANVLERLWVQTPAAARPTGRAMHVAAPLFAALVRGILGELEP